MTTGLNACTGVMWIMWMASLSTKPPRSRQNEGDKTEIIKRGIWVSYNLGLIFVLLAIGPIGEDYTDNHTGLKQGNTGLS